MGRGGKNGFQEFENGACCMNFSGEFLKTLKMTGYLEEFEMILNQILETYAMGNAQNGVICNNYGAINRNLFGFEWRRWDGKGAGYEGFLADCFSVLTACVR